MPFQQLPYLAITCSEPHNDVAWMNAVLSPSEADANSRPAPPFTLADRPALELDPDLPPTSFRLQFLRAWIAAREGRPAEAPGHA